MDLRRLRKGEWIAAISGVVLLISLFLPWSEAFGAEFSGWQTLSAADVFLAVLGISAVVVWGIVATAGATAPGVSSQALLTPFALVMFIVSLIEVWEYDGFGAWVGLAAVFGVLVGVLVGMRDERLSTPDQVTDATGVPAAPPQIETLPGPPAA
jgi:4-amino-4-deoxy-L-arabinose transferase-like glycosyltransferase